MKIFVLILVCKLMIGLCSLTFDFIYLLTYFLTYLLIPWSGVLLEKLTDFQLVRKFPAFYVEPEVSLPQSQVPTTCPYPEPARSSSHPQIPLPEGPS